MFDHKPGRKFNETDGDLRCHSLCKHHTKQQQRKERKWKI